MTPPTVKVEIDFEGNPTASSADILTGDEDVVSFWRANSTSTFLDENDLNDGVIVGTPTTTAGPYDYDTDLGLTFDGSSDAAYVLSSASLAFQTAMTVSFWVKLASLPGSTRDVIAKRGAWLFQVDTAGRLLLTLKDDTSTATVTTTTALATGTWYFVVGVYTDTAINLYLDGVLEATAAYSSGMGLDGQPVWFAAGNSTTSPAWQSTTNNVTTSATVTVNKPASTASGDLLLAHLSLESGETVTAAPTGWVKIAGAASSTGTIRSDHVYRKVAGGSEPASYSWTLSASSGYNAAISRFTGVDQVEPIGNAYSSVMSLTQTPTTGTHLPNTDNNLVCALFAHHVFGATFTISSGTEHYDLLGGGSIAMSTQTQGTATSLSVTGTSTGANTNNACAFLVVLNGSPNVYAAVSLDDAAVWNRALDAQEVSQLYESRSSGEGTWTLVDPSDVRTVATRSGRQYELDRIEAATAQILLRDLERDYDPANENSPYYPNVIPMRRVRFTLTHAAVDYPIFTGYIERWPPTTNGPFVQEIQLTAVDGFDALSQADVSGDVATAFSGAQVDAILNKAYWPADLRTLDTGQYVMLGDETLTGKALAVVQDITDSELGVFFVDTEGNATFHDRAHRGTQTRSTTPQAVFSDEGTDTGYHELSPSFDRDLITNEWSVSPHTDAVSGAIQTVRDQVSIAAYFLRSKSRQTRLASNVDALAQANQLLNETAQPNLRFDSLVVTPRNDTEWAEVLSLQISDRVTLIRTPVPGAGGTTIDRDCFIEGVSWQCRPGAMQVTFALSPVSSGDYYNTIRRDGPISYWRMDTVT